jgi:hypothetical protein
MDARGSVAWPCLTAVIVGFVSVGLPVRAEGQQSIEHRADNPLASALPVTTSNRDQFKATKETENFVVFARTAEAAEQVAEAAEQYRYELARLWLGKPFDRPWRTKCPIYVRDWLSGAGGATTFTFSSNGGPGPMEVGKWKMDVQGPLDRILDSVVPHEVNHTIFATYFRQPLPRWADEGAATLMECDQERRRQQLLVRQVLEQKSPIPLQKLFEMTEYPNDMQRVYTLYAQGYSIVDLLVQKGGRARFIDFLRDALRHDWDASLAHHYGIASVASLEAEWKRWVLEGSPPLKPRTGVQESDTVLADARAASQSTDVSGATGVATPRRAPPRRNDERPLVRAQAPDDSTRNARASTQAEASDGERVAAIKTPPIPIREPKPGASRFDAFEEESKTAAGTAESKTAGTAESKTAAGTAESKAVGTAANTNVSRVDAANRSVAGRGADSSYGGEPYDGEPGGGEPYDGEPGDDLAATQTDSIDAGDVEEGDAADSNSEPRSSRSEARGGSWPLMADVRDGAGLRLGRRVKSVTPKWAFPTRSMQSDRHAEKLTPPWRRSQRNGSEVASHP